MHWWMWGSDPAAGSYDSETMHRLLLESWTWISVVREPIELIAEEDRVAVVALPRPHLRLRWRSRWWGCRRAPRAISWRSSRSACSAFRHFAFLFSCVVTYAAMLLLCACAVTMVRLPPRDVPGRA